MIAIIDGDVLCYHACKPRWEKKARIVDGVSFVSLDSDGKKMQFEFTEEENKEYLEECWINLQIALNEMLESVFCEDFVMAVKSPTNFRNDLYPEYKLQRRSPSHDLGQFVPHLRKRVVAEGWAIESTDREADDLLRIWAEQARAAGIDYVICSVDKDLKCIPGKHWLMHKKTLITISEEEACRHYYEQLLKGDPTDNIPGVPRIGEVKAAKLLADLSTEEEFQECVVEQYMIAYDKEWRDYLLSNGKMIHLQKHSDDYFNFSNWPVVKALDAVEMQGQELLTNSLESLESSP